MEKTNIRKLKGINQRKYLPKSLNEQEFNDIIGFSVTSFDHIK